MGTDYLVSAALGLLVGLGELVGRYRDEPGRALRSPPAALYLTLNAGASAAALALVRVFGWSFGATAGTSGERWTRVLVAGFGAMALFRTSLFIVRAGDQDIGVGPSSFLQVILAAVDRGVDRTRAKARARKVAGIMKDVTFAKAHQALPAYCLALMQNLAPEEPAELARQLELLEKAQMEDFAKVLALGLLLMNLVGQDVLEAAVKSLSHEIK